MNSNSNWKAEILIVLTSLTSTSLLVVDNWYSMHNVHLHHRFGIRQWKLHICLSKYRQVNGLVVNHVAFGLRLCGLIPAIFLRSNCWVRLPQSLPSCAVLPGLQETVGCPPPPPLQAACAACLPRRSEFPLKIWRPLEMPLWSTFGPA